MAIESMLAHLIRKEAYVRGLADPSKQNASPIQIKSALEKVAQQKSQIAPVNGGNPITGEGVTK